MANLAASKRQLRVDAKRTLRNKSVRTGCKSSITKAEKSITSDSKEDAQASVINAQSTLDKAASKGIIHPNNAARRKSRLAKKLNSKNS